MNSIQLYIYISMRCAFFFQGGPPVFGQDFSCRLLIVLDTYSTQLQSNFKMQKISSWWFILLYLGTSSSLCKKVKDFEYPGQVILLVPILFSSTGILKLYLDVLYYSFGAMWYLAAIRLLFFLSLCVVSWTIMSWAYFSLDFWTGALLKRESYMLYKDPRAI